MAMTLKQTTNNDRKHTKQFAIAALMIIAVTTLIVYGSALIPSAMSQDNGEVIPTQGELSHRIGATAVPDILTEPRQAPPEPFSILVNGHEEPTTIKVARGETAQINVSISPRLLGIVGDVYVSSSMPVCGIEHPHSKCMPEGITASISENRVSSNTDMVLTVNVAKDMPVGTYPYQISAKTTLNVEYQESPVRVGNISVFAIEVT